MLALVCWPMWMRADGNYEVSFMEIKTLLERG